MDMQNHILGEQNKNGAHKINMLIVNIKDMIISTIIIIGTTIGFGTGLLGGIAIGYAVSDKRRHNREINERYDALIKHIYQEDEQNDYNNL